MHCWRETTFSSNITTGTNMPIWQAFSLGARNWLLVPTACVLILCSGHPFDTYVLMLEMICLFSIKLRMQTEGKFGRFNGVFDCVKSTWMKEGVKGFYKGSVPPLFGWALMDAVMLGTLTFLKVSMQQGDPNAELSLYQHALAGIGLKHACHFTVQIFRYVLIPLKQHLPR